MKAKKIDEAWALRLDPGEPIAASIRDFCEKEKIRAGSLTGIGSCRNPTLGFFDWEKKAYHDRTLSGDFEIAGLSGNIGVFEGKALVHLHATLGDSELRAWAGHLREAETCAVCEIILRPLAGELIRQRDPETGMTPWA